MCGITGILALDKTAVDSRVLRRMTDILAYRGPDGKGYFVDGSIGLGHRRLAIIDLSRRGKQPMSDAEGRIWVTFNGEIYNFRELRSELERKGHRFASDTDTETIIYAYKQWGESFVKHLEGMFALGLWDSRKRRLVLARDRVGQKPLWYYIDRKRVVFASELKAILQHPHVLRDIRRESIAEYMAYGYVPAPFSIFKGVKKIMPGCMAVVEHGRIRHKRYWDLQFAPRKRPLAVIEHELLATLDAATRARLMSDVPLGAFLSGGIDSSAVVALMARAGPVKTFSIGFEDSAHNELPYARMVAEKYSTDHREFVVKPDAFKALPELVWLYNEPYADSSALPSYYLAKMTRKHVTVALNGDGGDECFAGYERHKIEQVVHMLKPIHSVVRMLRPLTLALPEPASQKNPIRKAKRLSEVISLTPAQRYSSLLRVFPDKDLHAIAPSLTHDTSWVLHQPLAQPQPDNLSRLLYCDTKRYLPDDLLVKMDIATMAHSLEARSPFLDKSVLEFAAAIPSAYKLHGMTTKYILKRAVRHLLPKQLLNRKKMGFGVPIGAWFRTELRQFASDILLDQRTMARGYLERRSIQRLLNRHTSGRENNNSKIWSLLCLELWHRTYIDQERIKPIKL